MILPDSIFSVYVNSLLPFATTRGSGLTAGFTVILLQTSGLILLIATWGTQSTGLVSDPAIVISGVERCILLLTEVYKRNGVVMRAL
jgi:hypothetical protein